MSTTKPTIVLIPGAWHSGSCFSQLTAALNAAGYSTRTPTLPGVASPNQSTITQHDDVAYIRNEVLLPLLAEGKDVLLAMHSYGGAPGSAASKGLSKKEREGKGEKSGIIGQVFIASFVLPEGTVMGQAGAYQPWQRVDVSFLFLFF